MRELEFTKMQGLGNDFIVVEGPVDLSPDEVARLCDRRFGVGGDGVLVISKEGNVRMQYWNSDGSPAEMCGNGLRCVARYVHDGGWVSERAFTVDTPVGERGVEVFADRVEAELGRTKLEGASVFGGRDYRLVDMGNPHAVTFVDDVASVDVTGIGVALQSEFEEGVNVEFATVTGSRVDMRVWERGVGETLACGTGIAAVAAVAADVHGLESPVEVSVPGGQALVDFRDGAAWIIGPAKYSFRGSVGGH